MGVDLLHTDAGMKPADEFRELLTTLPYEKDPGISDTRQYAAPTLEYVCSVILAQHDQNKK